MLSLGCAAIAAFAITGSSTAHYVYGQGYIYKGSSHCTWGRAEISHGSGGGYTKISVGGTWAIRGACINWNLASAKYYGIGKARVRHELWKRRSDGSWFRCRSSDWEVNYYPIGPNSAGWVPTFDHSINYGKVPPCGSGRYGVTGYMHVYDSGAWRGGKIDGGQHSLRKTGGTPKPPGTGGRDTVAPSKPQNLSVHDSDRRPTSLRLTWNASTDNVAVRDYLVYLNGAFVGTVGAGESREVTFRNLTCNTTYTLAVAARDAAGNLSPRGTLNAQTAGCAPTGDTIPPSTPQNLSVADGDRQPTSLRLTWNASTDNVAVRDYLVYLNGAFVGTVGAGESREVTFRNLTCNTTYTLAVAARDAAGNLSPRGTLNAQTAGCQ